MIMLGTINTPGCWIFIVKQRRPHVASTQAQYVDYWRGSNTR